MTRAQFADQFDRCGCAGLGIDDRGLEELLSLALGLLAAGQHADGGGGAVGQLARKMILLQGLVQTGATAGIRRDDQHVRRPPGASRR
ncbi:MAG: hypothetical protein MUE97_06375 [Phycisphaerales bacterium]|nr:hypothetical protein [Phycisphaerales bacterium]